MADDRASAEAPIRWGRVFAAILALCLVLEATVQAFVYRWAGGRYRSLYPYVWSGFGLVRNNPELTSNAYQINANGFRNLATFTKKKPERTLRFIVIGGSVMYSGLGGTPIEGIDRVDSSSTIAQYLEQDLRADPALAGLGIEVINAAVNFNRIKEASAGYVNEWAFWDPDFVIYGASGNNFVLAPPKGLIEKGQWGLQSPHEWTPEFNRIANDRSPAALFERGASTLEAFSAAAAVTRKGLIFLTDTAIAQAQARAAALGIHRPPAAGVYEPASFEEYEAYIQDYLGYADAMVAVARRHHQELSFFWEYALSRLGGVKPMGPVEQWVYDHNKRPNYVVDGVYDARAHDEVARFCAESGVTFLDPIDRLRTYDGLVYIDYLHYTREGNRFMAKFVYDTLKDAIHRRADAARGGER
jgi:hypothetical protein